MKIELETRIKNLLDSQQFAVLSTIVHDKTYPYCSIVGFVHSSDLSSIYFVTAKNTNKFNNLINNPGISLLIDNRTNKNSDFKEAVAVTVMGKSAALEEKEKFEYKSFILEKLPGISEFYETSDCALIRINVEKYIFVSRFQTVEEFLL